MSDQDRISPYNINTISSRHVIRIKRKYQKVDYYVIQYQILRSTIITIVLQTVRRVTNLILGVKGLISGFSFSHKNETSYFRNHSSNRKCLFTCYYI